MSKKIPDTDYMKGYKYQIYPTDSQKEFIDNCIDTGRFIYNWALSNQIDHFDGYKEGNFERKFYSTFELQEIFTQYKKTPGKEWLKLIPIESARSGIKRVNKAITMMSSKNTKHRFPKFKTKKFKTQSYQTRGDRLYNKNGRLKIEGLPYGETILSKIPFDFDGRKMTINNPVISRDPLGNYYFSFTIEEPKIYKPLVFDGESVTDNVIGIDLNVMDRFVCSNGYRSGCPDISRYRRLRSKCHRRYSKDLERKKQWEKANPEETYVMSKRALKRENRYKKVNRKIANVVENFTQNETTKIIRMNPTMVVMEHLSNVNMQSVHHIAKKTYQAAFYRCRQVMENKCKKHSIPFMLAHRTFASSQLCSSCGYRQKIGINKIYECPVCGLSIDRDLNAALNLKKLAFT